MLNFNNNLNKAFLTLIFLVSTSFYNENGFAEQKRKFDNFPTTCQIKEYKITCDNFEINNNFRVNLYNNPNRIFLNFEKKIIVSNKNTIKNSLIKNVRLSKKKQFWFRISLGTKTAWTCYWHRL